MDLLALTLSLSLPLSGGTFTGEYALDVTPTVLVEVPLGEWGGGAALTLPGVVLYDPDAVFFWGFEHSIENPELIRHELMHVEQQQALGPAFWVAYVATNGQAFEPREWSEDYRFELNNGGHLMLPGRVQRDYSQMWMPPSGMDGRFPLLRLARENDRTRLQYLPGYPGLIINTN
jgi:hypothetical protein